MEELATVRLTAHFFDYCWQLRIKKRCLHVPRDVQTLESANRLAFLVSTKLELCKINPLKIMIGKGVHQIVGNKRMKVTCSYIIFVGNDKDQTTVRGGFKVDNQQHVKFEELTITNQSGPRPGAGLSLTGIGTTVELLNCIVKRCGRAGMQVRGGATVRATQCEFRENGTAMDDIFLNGDGVYCSGANTKAILTDCTMHHNGRDGLFARNDAVVDLHGTNTSLDCNEFHGMYAFRGGAKINIHLPPSLVVSDRNVGDDRHQARGGSIANINPDGTFTHT